MQIICKAVGFSMNISNMIYTKIHHHMCGYVWDKKSRFISVIVQIQCHSFYLSAQAKRKNGTHFVGNAFHCWFGWTDWSRRRAIPIRRFWKEILKMKYCIDVMQCLWVCVCVFACNLDYSMGYNLIPANGMKWFERVYTHTQHKPNENGYCDKTLCVSGRTREWPNHINHDNHAKIRPVNS